MNQTLSYQGRLLNANGSVVPDGYYNMQFKIYQDGDGTAAGDTGGTLKWTESYVNNNASTGVKVTDGFFSVNLGSLVPFGTSVDWNQDTLWLSMNVAGSSNSCTTFNSSPCTADGEMLPMRRITSTPYALNSGQLQGKTASNFVQLAQGVQTDASSNTSSIFINKTSTGNLIELQKAATDVFTVDNTGNLTFGNNANKTISIATAATATAGNNLSVVAGGGGSGTGSNGGSLSLQGGAAGGTNGNGGNVVIDAGATTGSGTAGTIAIGGTNAGSVTIGGTTSGSNTNVIVGSSASAATGSTTIQSKNDTTLVTNGTQRARLSGTSNTLYLGNSDDSGQANTASNFSIQGTTSNGTNAQGGSVSIIAGAATNGTANGGNIRLIAGSGIGTTASTGLVVINTPTFQAANQQGFFSNGTLSKNSVEANGTVIAAAYNPNLTITMNSPTNDTAGRIVFVEAAVGAYDFNLSINGGTLVKMHAGATTPFIWDGSFWSAVGSAVNTTLQDSYNTSVQQTGTGTVALTNGSDNNGVTFQNSSTNSVTGSLLAVKDASSNSIFAVNNTNVKVGNSSDTTTTVLSLDKAASAPTVDSSLVGSMYYDTTLGEVQCYEASGWGNCSSSPDIFINLSPEYSNAVMHGDGTGTMTNDLCSADLHINDGTSSQPTVCGTHETYNYYDWTSAETTAQTRSIYVTYQLPSNFKGFVANSTSLAGRTDSSNASVSYQVYHNNSTSGLTACGSAVAVSTGTQTSWQRATAASTADPASCSFQAGDSIVFKIDLTAANAANAYVSTLGFALK